jgi:hypothetical protein
MAARRQPVRRPLDTGVAPVEHLRIEGAGYSRFCARFPPRPGTAALLTAGHPRQPGSIRRVEVGVVMYGFLAAVVLVLAAVGVGVAALGAPLTVASEAARRGAGPLSRRPTRTLTRG